MFINIMIFVIWMIIIAATLGIFAIVYPKYAHWYAVRHPEVRNPEQPSEYWER